MIETLRWWLAATLIGLIAAPYAFRLFRFLPDRGLTVARTLGIVLAVYPLWILSVLGLLPYTAGSAVLLLAVLATGALVLAGRDRREVAAHLRARARLLITAELVFAGALAGLALLRAYAPAIDATEKLFELGLFNGALRSPRMPPADPWFGGQPMSYYYGGYLVAAFFTKLTGVSAAYGFNLGVILTGALVAVSVFGLSANLVLALNRLRIADRGVRSGVAAGKDPDDPPSPSTGDAAVADRSTADGAALRTPHSAIVPAIVAGLLAVVLMLVIGNLEGVFELAAAHGWGSTEFYQRLGIVNLTGLVRTQHWYPDEFWFWWRATRLGSDWNIIEFPFFSFMLGDLHAHVLVLPYALLGLAAVLNLLRGGELPAPGFPRGGPWARQAVEIAATAPRVVHRHPWTVLILGVLAGMLALSNSWDQPVFLLILFTAALTLSVRDQGITWRAFVGAALFVAPIALLSVALYAPFFADLKPATQGIRPVQLTHPPAGIEGEAMVSPPHHFLIAWGPLLLVTASGILAQARRLRAWNAPSEAWSLALTITFLPLMLWAAAVVGANRSLQALGGEIRARATWWAFGSYWIVQLAVLGLFLLALVTLLAEAERPHRARRAARMYLVLVAAAGLLVLHVIELFYVLEPTPSRINTLFKFSFIVWMLLASAGGAVVVDVLLPWWRRGSRPAAALWSAGAAAVLLLALVYPITAAMNRTEGFAGTPTLDGLAFLRQTDPDEYDATMWLDTHLPGRPLILEAAGPNYSLSGRVSARTGFPTVLGWQGHEAKLRGGRDYAAFEHEVNARAADVETIYRTTDSQAARDLLARYGVDYVYLGRLERERFGTDGVAKFEEIGAPVYRNRSVTIYQIVDQPPSLGSSR